MGARWFCEPPLCLARARPARLVVIVPFPQRMHRPGEAHQIEWHASATFYDTRRQPALHATQRVAGERQSVFWLERGKFPLAHQVITRQIGDEGGERAPGRRLCRTECAQDAESPVARAADE